MVNASTLVFHSSMTYTLRSLVTLRLLYNLSKADWVWRPRRQSYDV